MEKQIQQKVQLLLPVILRTVGPVLLRSGIGGLGGGGGGGSTSTNDDDDGDDDDDNENSSSNGGSVSSRKSNDGRKVSISLPTFPPDADEEEEEEESANDVSAKASTKSETFVTSSTTPSLIRTSTEEAIGTSDAEGPETSVDSADDASQRIDIRDNEQAKAQTETNAAYAGYPQASTPSDNAYLPPYNSKNADSNLVRRRKAAKLRNNQRRH